MARGDLIAAAAICCGIIAVAAPAPAQNPPAAMLTGAAAFGDWRRDAPGVRRLITEADLPTPNATPSSSNSVSVVARPPGAQLAAPPGFAVQRFAAGFATPRTLRIAPNGDIFLAETGAGQVRVLRAAPGAAQPERNEVFAGDLEAPFGIAFYPPGPEPRFVYVAAGDALFRFPYRNGDLKARGAPERLLGLPTGGHFTRDVAFSRDGKRMFVSIGSASNVAQGLRRMSPEEIHEWERAHGRGALWDEEEGRADVLAFDPDGGSPRTFATGLRNCVGLAVQPATGALWCATNERDDLGDDLPPDYATEVREGAFYGWPWYYIGAHPDPRHRWARPDLRGAVTVPDVLFQPHSAPLGITFYEAPSVAASAFPAAYRGDAFVALHGSWNRSKRTGYKIVRLPFKDGHPTGAYEDFLTGFVIDDRSVWGRPVGLAVARDGALLVSEDGGGTLWRIAYTGGE
jgi:glucose/arabinose dehydrogenase